MRSQGLGCMAKDHGSVGFTCALLWEEKGLDSSSGLQSWQAGRGCLSPICPWLGLLEGPAALPPALLR